jgi:hypothetical protein
MEMGIVWKNFSAADSQSKAGREAAIFEFGTHHQGIMWAFVIVIAQDVYNIFLFLSNEIWHVILIIHIRKLENITQTSH